MSDKSKFMTRQKTEPCSEKQEKFFAWDAPAIDIESGPKINIERRVNSNDAQGITPTDPVDGHTKKNHGLTMEKHRLQVNQESNDQHKVASPCGLPQAPTTPTSKDRNLQLYSETDLATMEEQQKNLIVGSRKRITAAKFYLKQKRCKPRDRFQQPPQKSKFGKDYEISQAKAEKEKAILALYMKCKEQNKQVRYHYCFLEQNMKIFANIRGFGSFSPEEQRNATEYFHREKSYDPSLLLAHDAFVEAQTDRLSNEGTRNLL